MTDIVVGQVSTGNAGKSADALTAASTFFNSPECQFAIANPIERQRLKLGVASRRQGAFELGRTADYDFCSNLEHLITDYEKSLSGLDKKTITTSERGQTVIKHELGYGF